MAQKVYFKDKVYLGMVNIGYNPTFTALPGLSLEVNILILMKIFMDKF